MSQASATTLLVRVAMKTDAGQQRQQNQDAIGHLLPTDPDVLERLGQVFVLADGVGGLSGGDLASQYAVSTIISSYYEQEDGDPPERLARAIAEANQMIFAEGHAQESPVTMATTVVTAVVRGSELVVGSVGDSPAYLIRDGDPRKLTRDHTLEEQQRESGQPLSEGGRRLVRALGVTSTVKVDIITGRVRDDDVVVLCSDGLTRYVDAEAISALTASFPVERAVNTLVETANARGGADNISVIVLRLEDTEELARLPFIRDPMEDWGRPRRVERARIPQPEDGAPAREARPPRTPTPLDKLLHDVWQLARANVLWTAIAMSVLLVVFVVIMLLVADTNSGGSPVVPAPTTLPAQDQTSTARVIATATARVSAVQTEDAALAATAAQSARQTLTPPSPIPTSGPQLLSGMWFRVLEGEPIQTYTEPRMDVEVATPLTPDMTYRVSQVTHTGPSGPWYQVVDNQGAEVRWVNAPSLHQRIVAVGENGLPLPDDQQPEDVPLPGSESPTPSPVETGTLAASRSPAPETSATPGPTSTPITPAATPTGPTLTPSITPTISYGEQLWEVGTTVVLLDTLNLCRVPDVSACDMGQANRDEEGTIVNGPEAGGEHWWWEIEFQDGRSGWIAQVLLALP